jgi:hypothetical protein
MNFYFLLENCFASPNTGLCVCNGGPQGGIKHDHPQSASLRTGVHDDYLEGAYSTPQKDNYTTELEVAGSCFSVSVPLYLSIKEFYHHPMCVVFGPPCGWSVLLVGYLLA